MAKNSRPVMKLSLKPPLKWAGGKRWLLPYLSPIWLPHQDRRLVEPFCGGLAVALGLAPRKALLNDVNTHLVNFYQWLKRGLTIDIEMVHNSEAYYQCREQFNQLTREGRGNSKTAAELFYYLNHTGYNGLCRINHQGEFNVPFGKYKTIHYETDFTQYLNAFSAWEFTSGDFTNIALGQDDFIYADPPYDVEFTQYSRVKFGWEEQVRLAEWLVRHPGPVVLSNQATERIVRLYEQSGFSLLYLDAPRMINCTGDRKPAREVLAIRGI